MTDWHRCGTAEQGKCLVLAWLLSDLGTVAGDALQGAFTACMCLLCIKGHPSELMHVSVRTDETRSAVSEPSSTEEELDTPVDVTTSCPVPATPGTVTLSDCRTLSESGVLQSARTCMHLPCALTWLHQ